MAKDWQAVAEALQRRLDELDMTQSELVHRSRVAPMTVRELLFNTAQRKRSPHTLAAVSEALGWPSDHLAVILAGQQPTDPDADDPVLTELNALKDELTTINARLDALEQRLAADDERA